MATPSFSLQFGTLYASNDASWFTGTGGPWGWSPWTAEFGGTVSSAGLAAEPFRDTVYQVAAGDQVSFVIALQNLGDAAGYDVHLTATLPSGFVVPADTNLTVTDGNNADLAFSGDLFSADGLIISPALAAYDPDSGANIVLVTYTLEAGSALPGPEIDLTPSATLVHAADSPGGADLGQSPSASTDIVTAAPTVTVTAETDPGAVAKGQTVAFDVTVKMPAGSIPDLTLQTLLPAGASQLDFVSATLLSVGDGLSLGPQAVDADGTMHFGSVTASDAAGADDTLVARIVVRASGSQSGTATLRTVLAAGSGWSAEVDSGVGVIAPAVPPTITGTWPQQWSVAGRAVHPLAAATLIPSPGNFMSQIGTLSVVLQDGGGGRLSGPASGTVDATGHTFIASGSLDTLQAALRALVLTPDAGGASLAVTLIDANGGVVQDAASSLTVLAGAADPGRLAAGPLAVQGSDSLLTLNGPLAVASAAPVSGAAITGGADLTFAQPAGTALPALEVAGAAGTTATVAVDGSGSLLDAGANAIGIGNGGTGTLTVTGGATVRAASSDSRDRPALLMGNAPGSVATLVVQGAGSTFTAAGAASIGRGGSATLTLDQAGTLTAGQAASGSGTGAAASFGLAVGDGTPARNAAGAANSPLYGQGTGSARVLGGSTLRSRGDLLVGSRGGNGTLALDGGSLAEATGAILLGAAGDRSGGNGSATIQGGSVLRSGGRHSQGRDEVTLGADARTVGTVSLAGAGSRLDANGGRLTIGAGGSGTLTIAGGAEVSSGAAYADAEAALALGALAGGVGTVNLTDSGSQLVADGQAVLGGTDQGQGAKAGGTGRLNLMGGLFRAAGLRLFGGSSISLAADATAVIGTGAGSAGTLTVDAGRLVAGSGTIQGRVVNNGTVSANGTLNLAATAAGSGTYAVASGTLGITSFAGGMLSFTGAATTVRLGSISAAATVSGFARGDLLNVGTSGVAVSGRRVTVGGIAIDFAGFSPNDALWLSADGSGGTKIVAGDALFDVAWYLTTYPDIARAGIDPYKHFLSTGWKEGRSAAPLFDTRTYLKLYPDVARAGIDPLLHYESTGWREGRFPAPLFDSGYYIRTYAATIGSATIPLADYLNGGALAGRNPDAWFDSRYYLTRNPDVARSGINPLVHYLQFGWKEGRMPSLLFDTGAYLRTYADVARAGTDPLTHFVMNGLAEGRMAFLTGGTAKADPLIQAAYYDPQLGATLIPTGTAAAQQAAWSYATTGWKAGLNPDAWFDTAYYLAHNPDVARAGVNPLLHYETTGWKEGRAASAQFSTTKYLAAYQDVARAGINPLLHFIQNGQAEGRHAFAV